MKIRIADAVSGIPRSGIRDFFEVVQTMRDVISLGIGEPDFATPWHIREAAIYSLEKGRTGYTSNLGSPALRSAISDYVSKHFGLRYDCSNEILVSVGVSEAIDLALRALLNPGDEVIFHEPCYVSYSPSILLAHGKPVSVATKGEDGFILRASELEAAITPKSKALVLNFPTNPTGATMPPDELVKIAEVCRKHDLMVLTDEIYSELTYDDAEHFCIANLPGMRERTLLLHGVSKAFAMTGWRIGFACGPSQLIDAMMKIHQYSILCAPIMSQEAATEALRHGQASVMEMKRHYESRRNFIHSSMEEMGFPVASPRGSFYIFPQIGWSGLSSREFSLRLLEEQKVAVVPGTAFGPSGEGFVRCSFATGLEQIKEAMKRMSVFCSALRAAA